MILGGGEGWDFKVGEVGGGVEVIRGAARWGYM